MSGTALRDDIFDAQRINFLTAQKELGKILEENDPEVRKALDDQIDQMKRRKAAPEAKPRSDCAACCSSRRAARSGTTRSAARTTRPKCISRRA